MPFDHTARSAEHPVPLGAFTAADQFAHGEATKLTGGRRAPVAAVAPFGQPPDAAPHPNLWWLACQHWLAAHDGDDEAPVSLSPVPCTAVAAA